MRSGRHVTGGAPLFYIGKELILSSSLLQENNIITYVSRRASSGIRGFSEYLRVQCAGNIRTCFFVNRLNEPTLLPWMNC